MILRHANTGAGLSRSHWRNFKRCTISWASPLSMCSGESFFEPYMEAALQELQARGLVTESQGALIVDLSASDMPPFLLKKQDGTTLYSTRDLATVLYRQRTWGFDTCLYVVDMGQSLHFAQLFKVLELAGFAWAQACHHIPFGLVLTKNPTTGKWEKGSTRQGNASLLKTVLEDAISMARDKIAASHATSPMPRRWHGRSGWVRSVFNDLKTRRTRDVKFDLETILNPYGETGPYMQYTHARCASVLAAAPMASWWCGGRLYRFSASQKSARLVRKLLGVSRGRGGGRTGVGTFTDSAASPQYRGRF